MRGDMEEWRSGERDGKRSIFHPCHTFTLHPSISHPPAAPPSSMVGSGALFIGTKSQGCRKETQCLGNSLIVSGQVQQQLCDLSGHEAGPHSTSQCPSLAAHPVCIF